MVSLSQTLVEFDKITPEEYALQGYRTDISDGWAIISSHQKDNDDIVANGKVTFYKQTEGKWVIFQDIESPNRNHLTHFGIDLAIDGNTALISSTGDHENGFFSGAVFVYSFDFLENKWVLEQKLKASDTGVFKRFGQSVDIKDNIIVVGSEIADGNETKSGAAYIFEKNDDGWSESQKIFATNGQSNDFFGNEVHIVNNSMIAIAAFKADGTEEQTGAVYLFSKETQWTQKTVLFDDEGKSIDLFGYCLESTQTEYDMFLFIGAPGRNNDNGQTGSVYIYSDDNVEWEKKYELLESTSKHNDCFGVSVSYSNSTLFVGASRTNTAINKSAGAVYAYENISLDEGALKTGTEFGDITKYAFDHFGTNVASYEEDVIVTAPFYNDGDIDNAGAIYFLRYNPLIGENSNAEELYVLNQNVPNPFSESAVIQYKIKVPGDVKLSIFNNKGQLLSVLVDEYQQFGTYNVTLSNDFAASGLYFCTLEINDFKSTKKILLTN